MNLIFFVFLGFILLLIIIVLYLIFSRKINTVKKEEIINVEKKQKEKIKISELPIPSKIESFSTSTLLKASTKIFDIFKAIDYANRSEHSLNKIEWHSWQVSILLQLLKTNYNLNVEVSKNNFHPFLYRMNKEEFLRQVDEILEKYVCEVNVKRTKDELCKDMLLSGREVSILFFLILNKKSLLK